MYFFPRLYPDEKLDQETEVAELPIKSDRSPAIPEKNKHAKDQQKTKLFLAVLFSLTVVMSLAVTHAISSREMPISEWETRRFLDQHMKSDRFSILLGTKVFYLNH